MVFLQSKEQKTSLLPASAQAAGEAVFLQLWARLPVKQCREGGGDCVPAPVLFIVQLQRSRVSQPSPLLPHPLIHKWKRWQCQKQTLNTEMGTHTELLTPLPTTAGTTGRHRAATTAAGAKQLLRATYLSTHRCCLVQAVYSHRVHRALQSIQSISAVIGVIYSKLFLVLTEIRPSLRPSTAQAELCTRELLPCMCKSKVWEGAFSFLLHSKRDWGINKLYSLSKVIQEDCSRCRSWHAADSYRCSYSHTGESCPSDCALTCPSLTLKGTAPTETDMNYITEAGNKNFFPCSGHELMHNSPDVVLSCAAVRTPVTLCAQDSAWGVLSARCMGVTAPQGWPGTRRQETEVLCWVVQNKKMGSLFLSWWKAQKNISRETLKNKKRKKQGYNGNYKTWKSSRSTHG